MAVILDADVIIRGKKGLFDLRSWLQNQAEETFEIAAVTVAALWHGVERAGAAHRARRQQYLERVLAPLPVIPYTGHTAREHARIWPLVEISGRMIGAHDLIVAATALERGSKVATFNRRHFEVIAGLQLIEPR